MATKVNLKYIDVNKANKCTQKYSNINEIEQIDKKMPEKDK